MKGIKKIFISIVMFLAFSMMSFFTIPSTKVNAACDHSNVFDPSNITYGNYYLDDVWTLTDNVTIDCTVFLCLNGHYIDMNGHTITIDNGGCLKLSSCYNVERYFKITDKGLYVLSDENAYNTSETGSYVYNSTATYGFNVSSGGNLYVENIAFVGCTGTIIKADTAYIDIENSRFTGNTGALIESNDSEVTIYGSVIAYNYLEEASNNLITEESGYLVINETNIYYNTLNENYYAVSSSACKIIALTVINQNYGGSIKRNLYFTDDLDIDSSFMGEIYLNCDSEFTLNENTYKGAIKSDFDNFVCYKDSDKITHYEEALTIETQPSKSNDYECVVSISDYNDYVSSDDQIKNIKYQWYYDGMFVAPITGETKSKIGQVSSMCDVYCEVTYTANGVEQTIKSDIVTNLMSLEIVIPTKESIIINGQYNDEITLPTAAHEKIAAITDPNTNKEGFYFEYGDSVEEYDFGDSFTFGHIFSDQYVNKIVLKLTHTDEFGTFDRVFTGDTQGIFNYNYFLIDDLKLTVDIFLDYDMTANICLNGHILDMDGHCFNVSSGTLNIYSCEDIEHKYNNLAGYFKLDEDGDCIYNGGVIINGGRIGNSAFKINSTFSAKNINFVNNACALDILDSDASIDNCIFEFNYGRQPYNPNYEQAGGAIYINTTLDNTVEIKDSTFKYNSSMYGGAIFLQNGRLSLEDVEITENIADEDLGDGIYLRGSSKVELHGLVKIHGNGYNKDKGYDFTSIEQNIFEIADDFDLNSIIYFYYQLFNDDYFKISNDTDKDYSSCFESIESDIHLGSMKDKNKKYALYYGNWYYCDGILFDTPLSIESYGIEGNYYVPVGYVFEDPLNIIEVPDGITVNIYLNDAELSYYNRIINVYGELCFYDNPDNSNKRIYAWNGANLENDNSGYISYYDGIISNAHFNNYGTLAFNNVNIVNNVNIINTLNNLGISSQLYIDSCCCGYISSLSGYPFIKNESSYVEIKDSLFNNISGLVAGVIYTDSKSKGYGYVSIIDSKFVNCYGGYANYIYSDLTSVNFERSGIEYDDEIYTKSKSEIYLINGAELIVCDSCFNAIEKVDNIIHSEKSKVVVKSVIIENFMTNNKLYFIEAHDSNIEIAELNSDREYPLVLGYNSNVSAGSKLPKYSSFKVSGTLSFPDGVEENNIYVIDTSLFNSNNIVLAKDKSKGYKQNFILNTNKFYIIEEENEGLYNTVLKIDAHKDAAHKEEYDTPLQSGGELDQLCYYLLEDTHIYEDIYIASGKKVKICLNGYNLILHDSKIINNGTLYITDCHKDIYKTYDFSTNIDGLYVYNRFNEGAIYVNHASICGCYEDAKNASSLLINTGECFLDNISFVGGLSNNNGGAIDNYNYLYIDDCTFSGNVAKKYGGAIYNNQNATVDIIFAYIDGNTAQYGGGIANKGEITVSSLSVICNKADIGSAIYNEYKFTVLKDEITNGLYVCNNTANEFATIYQTNNSSSFVVDNLNSIIAFNTSTSIGGGIYIDKGYAHLTASVYCNNGGLYVGVNSDVALNGVFAFINNEEYDIYIETGALIDLEYVAKQSCATFTVQGCSSTMNPITFTKETSAFIDFENITMRDSSYSIGCYTVGNMHVFKAQVPFTITYNKNGGSGNYIDSYKYGNGMYITLYGGSAFTKENAKIVGWATSQSTQTIAYKLNEEITINKSLVLYAVWKDEVICDCTKTVYKKFDGIGVDFLSGISGLSHLDNLVAKYKLHDEDDSKYTTDLPINAGKYDVLITREEDDYTLSFSHVFENVIEITKRNIELFATEDDFTYTGENQSESLVAYFVDVDGNNKYLSVTSIVSNGKNANFINAGTYYVTYKLSDEDYVNYALDANLVQTNTYMYEIKKLVATISSASIEGWTYGETPSTPSAITSYGEVKYEYALEGSTEFTTTVPTQAGKYMMRPYVEENDNISCETLIISFTIDKVSFDLSEAEWSYVDPITYDGLEHTVTLLNIPSEVTVEYTGNVATNAGTYTAHPAFTYDEDNYSVTPCNDLEWTINKYVYDMSDVAWNYSSAFTYDGEEHSVALNNIPEGLVYSYTDNKALYAGTYVAHVEFTYDNANYEVAEVSDLNWTINKYVYDMTNVAWDYTSAFTYDGEQHRVVINNIPEGLVYAYYNNNFTNAGTYVAHVEFIYDNVNYEVADIGELTWTINKIKVTVPTLKYTKEYTGQAINVDLNSDIYEAEQINVVDVGLYTFAINLKDTVNYEWINGGENKYASLEVTKSQVSISNFIVEDWTYGASDNEVEANTNFGEVVYTYSTSENGEYTNVAPTTPGTYYVKATVVGNDNYEGSSITRLFRIKKAKYVIDVSFDSITIPYDGTYHSLEIVGTLPEGVTVTYINNSAISAGVHNITVKFNGDYDNYEQIPDMEATITITKISYDMSNVSFVSKSYVYDGSLKQLTVMGTLPEGVNVRYYVNGKAFNGTLELGEYEITAFFTGDSANYNSINPMVARLTVLKGTYDLSNIQFKDVEYTYNGEEQTISISGELPNGLEVKYYIGENEFNGISEIGEYTVIAKFTGDFDHYYEVNSMEAKLIIKAKELKAETENSKLATLISDNGFASDLFVEVGTKQVEEAKETMIDYTDLNRYKVSMKDSEVVSHVYSVTVYRMVNGEKVEVPVSEMADGGEITIRLLVPSDIDPYYITGIIHAHSVDDVERIEFNVNDIDEYGYYEFNIDKLSEFAFIYNDIYYCKIHWMIVACLVLFVDFLLICWFVLRRQNLDLVTGMGFAAFAISLIAAFFFKNCDTCNLILYICLGILILSFVLFTIKKEVKIKEDKNGIYLFDEE